MSRAKREKPIPRTTKGKGANYRPTKSGAGMTAKGVRAYRKANPGSKLRKVVRLQNAESLIVLGL